MAFQNQQKSAVERIEQQLRQVDIRASTRKRLGGEMQSLQLQLSSLITLLPELAATESRLSAILAAAERVPSTQHIQSYSSNIFRDWAWGTSEVEASLNEIMRVLPPDALKDKALATLGAGASRLPLELHIRARPKISFALDINPVLLVVAKRILDGETIDLVEPRSSAFEDTFEPIAHSLTTSSRRPQNFHFVFADALNLPFHKRSLDAIFTPWFVDIVPTSFDDLAARINTSLKLGGAWLNFGPLGFQHFNPSLNLSKTEVQDALKEHGFEIVRESVATLPYLDAPHSQQRRLEKVYSFYAVKKKEDKDRPRYKFLPDHLTDTSLPFPRTEKTQLATTTAQMTVDLLSLVDGTKSLNEMAVLISKHGHTSQQVALEHLVSFFTAQFEKNNFA
jgi:hypothetical protein